MTTELSGVLTALATPFAADGSVDYTVLKQLVDRSADAGVDGVVAGGSTGEFAALDATERQRVLESTIEYTAGRVPVVAQTGATSTAEAARLSQAAVAAGADVIMLVSPYYEPMSVAETTAYIRDVAGAVAQTPIMLYNIPAATGVNLDIDTVHDLATTVDNVKFIKDSSADYEQGLRMIRYLRDEIGTFIGWDTYLFSALAEGGAGIMAGAANVVPDEIVEVVRLIRAGDLAGALAKWGPLYTAIDSMLGVSFIAAVKAGLRVQGIPAGMPRAPMADVSPSELAAISEALSALGRKVQS